MNDTNKEILDFFNSSGKSASAMTHALKSIGNGSMEAGVSRIGDYFKKEVKIAIEKGVKSGAIGSVIGITLVFATVSLVKKKIDESKKHKDEGEAILKGLEEALTDYSEEDNVLSDDRRSKNEEQYEGFWG